MLPKLNFFSGKGKKWFMSAVSFVALCALFGTLAYQLTKKPVTVILDGKKQEISSHAGTVGDLLKKLHVHVGKHDFVKPGLSAAVQSNMTIRWVPAVQVKVAESGSTQKDWTTAKTVGDFLQSQNIQVGPHDKLSPAKNTKITKGMEISYAPGFQVHINDAGKKEAVWTTAASSTVGDFLNKHNIQYDQNDIVKPAVNTPLSSAADITVTRISKKKVQDIIPVDYAVVTKKDSSLPKGKKEVLNPGRKGKIKKVYSITMKNGKEVSRKLIDTTTVKSSQARVVALGTEVYSPPSRGETSSSAANSSSSSHSGTPSATKQFYVSSTAYTADCSGCSGYTTTGINLKAHPNEKIIAVDPSVIPLGSKVWVQGYGYAIAADTGGAINGHTIDVYFPTKSGAYGWGTRTVLIKVLN